MDSKARAIRERLVEVAQHRDTIFYSDVARLADLHRHSIALFRLLDDISTHEHKAGRPLLTAVVVRKQDNMSGPGFFKLATQFGLHRDDYHDRRYNDKLFWMRERDRVYAAWTR